MAVQQIHSLAVGALWHGFRIIIVTIHTLDSEVKLRSVEFTGSNAVQLINKYTNKTTRKIKTSIHS